MALVPGIGELFSAVQFCIKLCIQCASAPGEFSDAAIDVQACQINLNCAESLLKKPEYSAYLKANSKDAASFHFYMDNLTKLFRKLKAIFDEYRRMGVTKRVGWALSKKGEVDGMIARLQWLTTSLDSFLSHLDRNIGPTGPVKPIRRVTASRLEEEFDSTGDANKSVEKATAGQKDITEKDKEAFQKYANQLSDKRKKRQNEPNKPIRRPGEYLECYEVRQLSSLGKGGMTNKQLKRGQDRLEDLVQRFRSSSFDVSKSKIELEGDDDRVKWVLAERRKLEKDMKYEWRFIVAKIEKSDKMMMGLIKEEMLIVIIGRRMTKEAIEQWQEKKRKEAARKKEQERKKKRLVKGAKKGDEKDMKDQQPKKEDNGRKGDGNKANGKSDNPEPTPLKINNGKANNVKKSPLPSPSLANDGKGSRK